MGWRLPSQFRYGRETRHKALPPQGRYTRQNMNACDEEWQEC